MNERNFFENKNELEPEVVTVDQWEGWKKAASPAIIETTGLGPCIGVVIYDSDSKQAMVGHFLDPMTGDFSDMLNVAVKTYPDKKNLKIYIGGGAPDPVNAPSFAYDKEKRNFIKEQLAKHGFQDGQFKIHYQNSDSSTILRIDTSTGHVEYDEDVDEYGIEDKNEF
ncbi:MAG: hypothetical protein WC477_02525 [Patescibacteria group bacterium]